LGVAGGRIVIEHDSNNDGLWTPLRRRADTLAVNLRAKILTEVAGTGAPSSTAGPGDNPGAGDERFPAYAIALIVLLPILVATAGIVAYLMTKGEDPPAPADEEMPEKPANEPI